MQLMNKILFLILSFFLFGFSSVQAADEVAIEITELRDGVYLLKGQGGNIGLSIGADGVFMIDDQFAPLTDKIRAAIAEISNQPIKFVINTHWHGDHTGGNENLAKTGSVLIAHDNVHKRLSTDQFMQAFGREVKAAPAAALPVITFTQQVGFRLNDDHIQALHVANAHTDGDAIIHFEKANILHLV